MIRRPVLNSTPLLISGFFLYSSRHPPNLHSFPTRRSSDLASGRFTSPPAGHGRVTSPERSRGYERCPPPAERQRSEEHTSELQSRGHLVCRLLLEKKKDIKKIPSQEGIVTNTACEFPVSQF